VKKFYQTIEEGASAICQSLLTWIVDEARRGAQRSPGVSLSVRRPNQGVAGISRSFNFVKRPGHKGFGDEWDHLPIG